MAKNTSKRGKKPKICDSTYRILHVNAKYPGRSHDSFIWNNSRVLTTMKRLHAINYGNSTFGKIRKFRQKLEGDFGYGLRPWLLTPINHPNSGPEERYTRRISHIRSIIERVNVILKMRFMCLLKERVLHYDPAFASKIINACVVLHNMCIANHLSPPVMSAEDDDDVDFGLHRQFPEIGEEHAVRRVNPEVARGRLRQRQII
ncbi:putative nuclease HARBI1 [Diachasma alloeum]|uniref:putative nuclease HARBI1 n=1 Tax=Diachasma alloeum TaxID=454923 RepID=UPI0010FB6E5A|nr:putative nuclease HARBI1 [Diachasma alloeum]